MGFGIGWNSAASGTAQVVAALVGQDIVAKSITLSQASGSNAIAFSTAGARLKVGNGTTDYFSSNGTTTITAAGSFAAGSAFFWGTATASIGSLDIGGGYILITPTTSSMIRSIARIADGGGAANSAENAITLATSGDKIFSFRNPNVEQSYVDKDGQYVCLSFTDDSANPGARTVNKVRGKNAVAAGASTCVITNSFCAATSQIHVTLEATDATALYVRAVTPSGTGFTLTVGPAAATGNLVFSWQVVN